MMMMLMWIVRIDNGEYQTYRRRPFHSRPLDQPRLKAGAKVLIYPTIETPGKSGNPREKIVKEIRKRKMKKKGPLCWNACYIEVDILKLPFSAKHCIGRYSSEEQENVNSFDFYFMKHKPDWFKGWQRTSDTERREPSKGLVSQFFSSKREIGLQGSFSLLLTAQISTLTFMH